MERQEIATLIAKNKSNYPNFYKDMGAEQVTTLLDSWEDAFKHLPAELVIKAYNMALTYCQFPVTIADIYTQLRDIQDAIQEPPEALWQQFLSAARRCRDLKQGYYYTAESLKYPGITQGQERMRDAEIALKQLPREAQSFVGNIGRLADFGSMDREHLEQVIFPAFRRFVTQERKRSMTLQQMQPAKSYPGLSVGWDVDYPLLEEA